MLVSGLMPGWGSGSGWLYSHRSALLIVYRWVSSDQIKGRPFISLTKPTGKPGDSV
jgi:hypothetical protein